MDRKTVENIHYGLTNKVWVADWPGIARITGVKIKCEPTGYLVILNAISAEGPMVGFVGARHFKEIARLGWDEEQRRGVRWRQDRYALDNLEKKQ